MKRKRHSPEQIIHKLRDADYMLSDGKDIAAAAMVMMIPGPDSDSRPLSEPKTTR